MCKVQRRAKKGQGKKKWKINFSSFVMTVKATIFYLLNFVVKVQAKGSISTS